MKDFWGYNMLVSRNYENFVCLNTRQATVIGHKYKYDGLGEGRQVRIFHSWIQGGTLVRLWRRDFL